MFVYLIGLIVGILGVNGLQFNKLPDGIIVTKGRNTSIIGGEWTLLLTIREDDTTRGLDTHADLVSRARTLWSVVEAQNISLFFTEDRRTLMKAKIGLVLGPSKCRLAGGVAESLISWAPA